MLQDPIENEDGTKSLNGSILDSSSITIESVLDPEEDTYDDDLNVLNPTITTTPTISNNSNFSDRVNNREKLQSERRDIAAEKSRSGVGMTSFPSVDGKPKNYIDYHGHGSRFQPKSSYGHYRDQYGFDSRRGNDYDGRFNWEDVYNRRRPPTNQSLTPGDYLGSARPNHYNRDRNRRRRDYIEEDSVDSDGDSMCNNHGNWDGPILTAVATPVQEELEIDKPEKVIKRTLCVQKLLVIIILILIAIASGAAIYGYQAGYFANDPNSQSPFNSPTDFQNNPTTDELLYSSSPTKINESPTPSPSNHPSFSNSESTTELKSQVPTMSTNKPTFVDSSIPSTAPTVPASSLSPTAASSSGPSNPPSILLTLQPSTILPTQAPTKGCEAWCVNHPTPWRDADPSASQKCKWPKTCGGCPQCEENQCKLWCANHPVPWWDQDPNAPQKCHWEENCAGCPQCSDPAFHSDLFGSASVTASAVAVNFSSATNVNNVTKTTNETNTTDHF